MTSSSLSRFGLSHTVDDLRADGLNLLKGHASTPWPYDTGKDEKSKSKHILHVLDKFILFLSNTFMFIDKLKIHSLVLIEMLY